MNLKKFFGFIFVLSLFLISLLSPAPVLANEESQSLTTNYPETINLLSSPTCPHCANLKIFLADFQVKNNINLNIQDYDIALNTQKARDLYQQYDVPAGYQGLVPALFVKDKYFVGFNDAIGQDIATYILNSEPREALTGRRISLPFIGDIDPLQYSLPALAVTLGIVDGFNVCSLGALVIILGLVVVLGSRRKIFLMGGIFLLTTGVVYAAMIFIWHRFFSFIAPYIRSLELLIGLLALAGGLYLLWEFYQASRRGPICSSNNIISRLSPKVEQIFKDKTNWFLMAGTVAVFATVVTVVEFPCSAFLPVLFTSILVESGIAQAAVWYYIGLYMLFYLLDELIIFVIAVLTMRIKIVSPRFIIFFNLLAALIFLALGIFYLAGLSL